MENHSKHGHKYLTMYEAPFYIARVNGVINVVCFLNYRFLSSFSKESYYCLSGNIEGVVYGLHQ